MPLDITTVYGDAAYKMWRHLAAILGKQMALVEESERQLKEIERGMALPRDEYGFVYICLTEEDKDILEKGLSGVTDVTIAVDEVSKAVAGCYGINYLLAKTLTLRELDKLNFKRNRR